MSLFQKSKQSQETIDEVYIIVNLHSNNNGITERPYLAFWDRKSVSKLLMCQLAPCWAPITTDPASIATRCVYSGIMFNGTMYPLFAEYSNDRRYPNHINAAMAPQIFTLKRNTPYLNEIYLRCGGAGIGAGTTVELWGVKYYG